MDAAARYDALPTQYHWPYQREGAAWLEGQRTALLADEQGLGKTVQVLAALPEGGATIVVCPAVAKSVWATLSALRPDLRATVLTGRRSFRWPLAGELVVLNYEILPPRLEVATRDAAAPQELVVILDEAQYAKTHWYWPRRGRGSRSSARALRAAGLVDAALQAGGRAWGLSGTPLKNRPPDMWGVLGVLQLREQTWPTWTAFCGAWGGHRSQWGYQWTAGGILSDTPTVLRRVMLRRVKATVLPQLPPRRWESIEVEIDQATQQASDEAVRLLEGVGVDLAEATTATLRASGGVAFEQLARARAKLATAKLPAALELLAQRADRAKPLLLWSAHRAPVLAVGMRRGWRCITGETPHQHRASHIAALQAGELTGLALTIGAGQTAVTLTAADQAIFVDRGWTQSENSQAEDRIHRIGQEESVLYTDLVADHDLDRRLHELLRQKRDTERATIDAAVACGGDTRGPVTAAEHAAAAQYPAIVAPGLDDERWHALTYLTTRQTTGA